MGEKAEGKMQNEVGTTVCNSAFCGLPSAFLLLFVEETLVELLPPQFGVVSYQLDPQTARRKLAIIPAGRQFSVTSAKFCNRLALLIGQPLTLCIAQFAAVDYRPLGRHKLATRAIANVVQRLDDRSGFGGRYQIGLRAHAGAG